MEKKDKSRIMLSIPELSNSFALDDIDLALYIRFGTPDVIEERIIRTEQHKLRQIVIARDKKCIVSGGHQKQCDTSHIKPYSECDFDERNDPDNCILLDKSLHTLFDNYFWTINPKTKRIEVSEEVKDDESFSIHKYRDKKLKVLDSQIEYIKLHYNRFLEHNDSL